MTSKAENLCELLNRKPWGKKGVGRVETKSRCFNLGGSSVWFAMVLVWYVIGLICYGLYGFVWFCMVLHGLVLYGPTSVTQSITSEPNTETW